MPTWSIRSTTERYGLVAVFLHWSLAVLMLLLFALGYWMVDLDYYHSWYQQAPWWHKSLGICGACLMLLRWFYRLIDRHPPMEPSLKPWERRMARLAHYGFYILILLITVSGYLIVTASGKGVPLFDWFEIPAVIAGFEGQEDIAGDFHRWLAWCFIGLTVLHGIGALKHHWYDKDRTLLKII